MKRLVLLLIVLPALLVLAAAENRTPLNRAFLQSNMDLNGFTLTNGEIARANAATTATNQAHLYYPEMFGAIAGDGEDDSAAWTAAWTAAHTNLNSTIDGRHRRYEINTNSISLYPFNLINRGRIKDAIFVSTNYQLVALISNSANYTVIEDCWFGSTNHPNTVSTAIRSVALPQGEWAELTTIKNCYFTNFNRQIWLNNQDNPVVTGNRGYGFKSNGLFAVQCDQSLCADNYFGFSYPIPIYSTNVLGQPDFYYGVGQPSWLTNSIAFQFDRGISWQMERNAINGVGQAVYADGYGAITKFTFINNDFESVFHPTRPRLQFTNCGGLTFIGNSYAVLNGYDDHAGLEMNNCRMGQSAIINSFFGGPQTNSISVFPAVGDPSGQLPVVIGGGQSIRTHSAYGDTGTEMVIPIQGTVANTLASEGNTFKNNNYFDQRVYFRWGDSGGMLNVIAGPNGATGNNLWGLASVDAAGNNQAFISYQDYNGGPNFYTLHIGGDIYVGRHGPTVIKFATANSYGGTWVDRWQIDTTGSLLPQSTAYNLGTLAAPSGYVYATNVNASGYWVKSNTIASWPTIPSTSGASFIGNSNGVIYILTSGVGNTWTATNKLAP